MIPQFAQFLSQTEVLRIHEASLEILEEAGLLVRNSRARERMAKRGCLVDEDTGIVRLPSALVEELCRQFPPTFTFRGRDPAFDKTLPDDAPVISTGSSAPQTISPALRTWSTSWTDTTYSPSPRWPMTRPRASSACRDSTRP